MLLQMKNMSRKAEVSQFLKILKLYKQGNLNYLGSALNGAMDQMPSRNPFQLKLLYGSVNLTLSYKSIIIEALSFRENPGTSENSKLKFSDSSEYQIRNLQETIPTGSAISRPQHSVTNIYVYISLCNCYDIYFSADCHNLRR